MSSSNVVVVSVSLPPLQPAFTLLSFSTTSSQRHMPHS